MTVLQNSLRENVARFYSGNRGLWDEIGSHFKNPETYLHEFKLRYPEVSMDLALGRRGLNFAPNKTRPVHRWSSYLEGFSEAFVDETIKQFRLKPGNLVLDPFAGSGTVNVCAKMQGIDSIGIEIGPTVFRILNAKVSWHTDPKEILSKFKEMTFSGPAKIQPPVFLDTERQFQPQVLERILIIKEQVQSIQDPEIRQFFEIAFMSILLPCSNLKRSPSIGYIREKREVSPMLPLCLFEEKVGQIVEDLHYVREKVERPGTCDIYNLDSKEFEIGNLHKVDAVITSPPYLNSFDYVGNYKLEIGWMDDAESTGELRELRDRMVLCDNVSRTMIREYSTKPRILDIDWIDYVTAAVRPRMKERLGIRRSDYPILIRKYFDDIFQVLTKMYEAMRKGGEVAWVVGDSLILDVYIPTDLITMIVAKAVGFQLVRVEIDRVRRSGIRRTFILRESILYFKK